MVSTRCWWVPESMDLPSVRFLHGWLPPSVRHVPFFTLDEPIRPISFRFIQLATLVVGFLSSLSGEFQVRIILSFLSSNACQWYSTAAGGSYEAIAALASILCTHLAAVLIVGVVNVWHCSFPPTTTSLCDMTSWVWYPHFRALWYTLHVIRRQRRRSYLHTHHPAFQPPSPSPYEDFGTGWWKCLG